MHRLCVFCGSSAGLDPAFADAARAVGDALARHRLGLVYGGGNIGLMGMVADAAIARGAPVIGVIPRALVDRELAHRGLTELRIVNTMHERKALMADLADAFLALPGGFGTLDELCEVLTWRQLGFHAKPCALLNVARFFDPFLAHLDQATAAGFLPAEHRRLLHVDTHPDRLVDTLRARLPSASHPTAIPDLR